MKINNKSTSLRAFAMAFVAGLLVLGAAQMATAHHAFVAEFDPNAPIQLEGKITKFDWVNPHSWIYLDVKESSGEVKNWAVEAGSPNSLFRSGWKKDSLKIGEEIIVKGFRGRGDGVRRANGVSVTFKKDGRSIFAASSAPASVRKDDTVYVKP